jgi:hypothetical protein
VTIGIIVGNYKILYIIRIKPASTAVESLSPKASLGVVAFAPDLNNTLRTFDQQTHYYYCNIQFYNNCAAVLWPRAPVTKKFQPDNIRDIEWVREKVPCDYPASSLLH